MRAWLVVYVKGICMGAADMVPGVSGGTIALIVGIYERLVRAIASLDPRALRHLPRLHRVEARQSLWQELVEMDVPFLVSLGVGIASAVVLMSRVMTFAFANFPASMNAFFFGLIGASAVVVGRSVAFRTRGRIAVSIAGFLLAFIVTGLEQVLAGEHLVLIFVVGAIASSAMILPGISGAAFLYILGQYESLLDSLRTFIDSIGAVALGGPTDAVIGPGIVVFTFIAGGLSGLLGVSRVVAWALDRYRMATLAFLVSLMLGSLRLPVSRVYGILGVPGPKEFVGIVAAVIVGAGIVLVLDWQTDSLAYTDATQ